MANPKYPHSGHRQRMRQRFLATGLTGFQDYEALELLLFYSIPRRDVRPMARELVRRFGSLQQVLEADSEELLEVPGIGPRTVALLHFIPGFIRQYLLSASQPTATPIGNLQDLLNLMAPYLLCAQKTTLYAVLLNRGGEAIAVRILPDGDASLTPRRLVERACMVSARSMILIEATDQPLTAARNRRAVQIRTLADELAIAQFPLVDYCLWSIQNQELASLQACGGLPKVRVSDSLLFL